MAEPASRHTKAFEKVVFSSEELPAALDDRARFSLWRDLYRAHYGVLDFSFPADQRFSVRCEFARFGGVALGQFDGTINRVIRTAHEVAAGPNNDFCLLLNRGQFRMSAWHDGQEAILAPGAATLFDCSKPGSLHGEASNAWYAIGVRRHQLVELVADAEDLLATQLDAASDSVRHLRRYLDILLDAQGAATDVLLIEHIGSTLLDLIGLALGASRDASEIARGRGVRTARLMEIIADIRARFADPAFSPRDVALKLGLTPRYVQELLSTTGASFTERVLELRLQKARAMLASPRHDRLRVSDIAYACGFNDISYFNRCFRRRFGASPLEYRASAGKG